MFNDLKQGQNNHQPVDDIFAETDKPNNNAAANIETHRVGLVSSNGEEPITASSNEPSQKSKSLWFKIIAVVIVLIIVALSAYLVYSKYFKASSNVVAEKPLDVAPATDVTTDKNTNATPIVTETSVVPISTTNQATTSPIYVSEIPGLASSTSSTTGNTDVVSTVDSDNDGLTDVEEENYKTNPLSSDTDKDGLSDYEEVKIYHTNPLSADTDGDGFLDGAEVKNGYNPNGAGKMPGISGTSATSIK